MAHPRSVQAALTLVIGLAGGCGDSGPAAPDLRQSVVDRAHADGPAISADRSRGDATRPADASACSRPLAAADRVRYLVVSHPFKNTSGEKAPDFEVLSLSVEGKLVKTGKTFQLGVASEGEIVFTPDGAVGLVALEDGGVGVFRLDGSGTPQVVHPAFKAKGLASSLVIAPSGDVVYLLSTQWRDVGGGVFRLRIGCDGSLTDEGLVAESKLPAAMLFLGGSRAALAGADLLSSTARADVHLLDWSPTPTLLGSADAFGDDDAIVSSMTVTRDLRYLLLTDTNPFSGTGNRVAAVEVLPGGLRAAQVLKPLTDPAKVLASPVSDVALVLNGEGDTITVLDYHPSSASAPFSVRGPVSTSSKVQLPYEASMITRGQLAGRVIVAENLALRQLQLDKSGGVSEAELFSLGAGVTAIPGALGVQP